MGQMQQLLDSAWTMVVNNYLEVIAAIVILVVGRAFAGWARRLTRKGLERGSVDPTLVPFVAKLVYYAVMAVVVIAAVYVTYVLWPRWPSTGSAWPPLRWWRSSVPPGWRSVSQCRGPYRISPRA